MSTEAAGKSGGSRARLPRWWRRGAAAIVLLLGACLGVYLLPASGPIAATGVTASAPGEWLPVKRGDFEILCREEGELRPVKVTTMTFLRWGKISYLIPESTCVKKGEKLVSLETKDLEEDFQRCQEDLAAGERDLAQREQNRDLDLKRLATELSSEKERAALAALRERELLAKPLPEDKEQAASELEGAKTQLESAKASLEAYKPLAEAGFGSGTDLAGRELAVAQAEVELERAQIRHKLAMAGAKPEERQRAKLEREQADLTLRIKEIDVVSQTNALHVKVSAGQRSVALLKHKLEDRKEELARSTLYAPHDGIAVYRVIEWRGNKKVEVGEQVGPWLSPMELPIYDKMKVRTQVPESFIRKIKARPPGGAPGTGSKARVTVKTLPDRVYTAEVTWIDGWARDRNSKLAEADIRAQGLSGVRVFDVEVELAESDPDRLREGFRATVEFPVETYPGMLSVPISAVTNRDGAAQVQVWKTGAGEWRKVELGMQSVDRVVVTAGLREGELVFAPRTAPPRPVEKPLPEESSDVAKNRGRGRRESAGGPPEGVPPPQPRGDKKPEGGGRRP
ncbi:MAG: hypothetical protein NTW87_17265 [Planctomycetota bacterium]|nr:hypothetical protein [Planctomycetota bacterium]